MKGLWINKNKKFVSLLLSLLLILGALPLHAIALGIGTSTSESSGVGTAVPSDGYVLNSQEYTTDELIGEVAEEISLREENVKHFRLSNGTYEAVIYGSPVHRTGTALGRISTTVFRSSRMGSRRHTVPPTRA